jgi:MFS family permease
VPGAATVRPRLLGYHEAVTDRPAHSSRVDRAPLGPVFVATFAAGVAIGSGIPLVPLALEARGIPPLIIGVNSAMWGVGLVCAGPLIPRWAARLGPVVAIWLALAASAIIQVGFAVTSSLPLWFLLRFAQGVATGTPWLISEIWINVAVAEERRGRALATYSALIAAGLAAGPLVLQVVGVRGPAPFFACAALSIAVGLPFIPVRRRAPDIRPKPGGSVWAIGRAAPVALIAALVGGLGETVAFIFLPVYAVRIGVSPEAAVLWQTAFVAGNIVLQPPIGWLADHLDRAAVMTGCALVSAVASLLLPLAGSSPWTVWPLLVAWGGAAFGIYTVGLALLGQRFAGGDIARANAAFVIVYTVGSVVGPPLSGGAMQFLGRNGLGASLAGFYAAAAGTGLVVAARAWRARWAAGDSGADDAETRTMQR